MGAGVTPVRWRALRPIGTYLLGIGRSRGGAGRGDPNPLNHHTLERTSPRHRALMVKMREWIADSPAAVIRIAAPSMAHPPSLSRSLPPPPPPSSSLGLGDYRADDSQPRRAIATMPLVKNMAMNYRLFSTYYRDIL